ncbi:MAG: response regulator transcription factor [Sporocytophaga sp.]|uniref:response regulator transcription factor n=1 Tax=Sporocytophaga sp. TaxID=2231183 RepID=UPI001B069721|nr:response regulator transcription factor [Sporocytophaga sp.]MBO9699588.1 response regulator transcription factor [Sporocytophaga sp.]
MKILIIEDEVNVASFIMRGFQEEGHSASIAMDGATGLQMMTDHTFDLVILDLMLPGINGMEVCRRIREDNSDVPIIMLTALGTTENVVSGLNAGADDYMIKPFKFSELLARIEAIKRRTQKNNPKNFILKFSNLEINTSNKTVKRGDEKITLTATEFKLLEYLMINQGRVLSRVSILENVWDINFDMNTNVVDVYINYLRKKIDKGFEEKLIHTVVGMGYVMRKDD